MKLKEFAALVETYGADPGRWPADRRAVALDLMARSEEARGIAAEAAALDALLAQDLNPAMPRLDPAMVVERAAAVAQPRPVKAVRGRPAWQLRLGWPNLVGLAAAAAIGFMIGWTGAIEGYAPAHADDLDDIVLGLTQSETLPW